MAAFLKQKETTCALCTEKEMESWVFPFISVSRHPSVISDPQIQECLGSTLTLIKKGHRSMMLSCGNTKLLAFVIPFNIHVKAIIFLNTK